ncbi:MAG: YkgJ family cysteine cluster protein [Planctomycetes bacterium]|nr:YkgJ family cysteine cluster protein [Planctomycetota bacterium]
MSETHALPVFMPAIPRQRWACHSCGNCCRTLVGHLFEEERRRLDEQAWSAELGVEPYVRAGRQWVLNKHPDGACVFLDENNRCRIHARYGEAAKPLACRIFPFHVRPVHGGWQASLRFDCPSVAASQGEPLAQHHAWLGELARTLDHFAPAAEVTPDLRRGLAAAPREVATIVRLLTRRLEDRRDSLRHRILAAARATDLLQGAQLENVRGRRFGELAALLLRVADDDGSPLPAPPRPRQRAMLRQLVFAHAEHVSLDMLLAGRIANWRQRWRQLRAARCFRRGKGLVPRLPGARRDVTFQRVEAVPRPKERGREIEDLLLRYLLARIDGHSCFGDGYYGWPVLTGLSALWLSLAVIGWLARYSAAQAERGHMAFDDVAAAVGTVDRAASRLPALGTVAERARLAYLSREDGIASLIAAYAPLPSLPA